MACDDRQLTQAQLEAGYQQQRTGVVQALRPFSGPPTLANLVDYVNRELGPAVRNARAKVNDCFQQVTDNAPSANPLGYYFSTNTANADPTAGRVRLDASPENTATTLRVSESNARLQDVSPWLDMMIGGSTIPLGVVTLMDAINPGRFLRGNLTNITPQTGYRDFAITVFEASHTDPFVDGEAVLVSYVAGMADGGVTVPVSVLAPIASDTFLGNVSGGTAAPSAVNLSTLAGAGLALGTHTLDVTGSTSITITSDQVQRAALTGAITATLNSNATAFGPLAAKSVLANATNASAVPAALAGSAAFQHLRVNSANNALEWSVLTTGDFPGNSVPVTALATVADSTFIGNIAGGTATPTATGLSSLASTSITYDAASHTFRRPALTGEVTASANSNACTVTRSTDFASTPWTGAHQFNGATLATLSSCATTLNGNVDVNAALFTTISSCSATFNGAVTCVNVVSLNRQVAFNGVISVSTAVTLDDWSPTGLAGANVIRLTATAGGVRLTGIVAQPDGTRILLVNPGGTAWTIDNEGAASTAANRILHNVDTFAIPGNDAVEIWYDGTSDRWRCIHQTTST